MDSEIMKPDNKTQLMVEVTFFGDDNRKEGRKCMTIEALRNYEWDGYRLSSIRLLCELRSVKDVRLLMEFLAIHQYCLGIGSETLEAYPKR